MESVDNSYLCRPKLNHTDLASMYETISVYRIKFS